MIPLMHTPNPSMREKAYTHLQQKIISGELPSGYSISEVTLARELGTSRTPLREAIGQLIAEGFLQQRPNGGTVVVQFSKRDVAELYEFREALEVYAVGQAAQQETRPQEIDALIDSVRRILSLKEDLEQSGKSRLSGQQMHSLVQIDMSFHALLLRVAGNSRILKVVSDTHLLINIFTMRRKGHDAAQLADIHRYHSEVADAVVRKDRDRAVRMLGEHIRASRQERLQEYEEWERETCLNRALVGLNIGRKS